VSKTVQRAEFERLVLTHRDAAYNLAMWLTASRSDAEDVVQDTFLRAWRAFGQLRGDSPRAWLLAIVRNTAYRHLQNRSRMFNVISIDEAASHRDRGGTIPQEIADDGPGAENLLIEAAEQAAVRTALSQLPVALREAIVLREMEELSYREIAIVMDTPIGTVMSRLSRARSELRKVLLARMREDDRAL